MSRKILLQAARFLLLLLAIALLATLTLDKEDPCANPQQDISGAILADDAKDEDALANRAILQRGACDQRKRDPD